MLENKFQDYLFHKHKARKHIKWGYEDNLGFTEETFSWNILKCPGDDGELDNYVLSKTVSFTLNSLAFH
uniref:Uncharacterized protein n=1 Tax=Romanomermis culicivorax TaxID=13658 RepID=A0A915J7G2_ROMCU